MFLLMKKDGTIERGKRYNQMKSRYAQKRHTKKWRTRKSKCVRGATNQRRNKKNNVNPQTTDFEKVRVIRDLKIALKDFEPMVKDPRHLWNGRDIGNFKLRPREAWANWLLATVLKHIFKTDITFAEDIEGDGLILDRTRGSFIVTEHVAAMNFPSKTKLPDGEKRVIDAINHKIRKGPEYAKGKNLVVFFDGAGLYRRDKIREAVYGKHNFVSIYCIGLLKSDAAGYEYMVSEFKDSYGDESMSYRIRINSDFTSWEVGQQKS